MRFALSDVLTAKIAGSFFNANTTSPPYPNLTPGFSRSLGSTAAINYSVYGTAISSHTPNGTTVGVSIANGSANASLCYFVVQDTMSVRFWTGKICAPLIFSCLAYQCEDYITHEEWFNFDVTSLIDNITQYIDTVITNHATRITATRTISTVTESSAEYQGSEENSALRPFVTAEALNETVVTGLGRTLWVIST